MEPLYVGQLTAFLVPFFIGLTCGALIAALSKWGLSRFALDLDYRLGDLEGRLNREVKVRAQKDSITSRKKNDSVDEWAQLNAQAQQPQQPFATDFAQWRKSKMSS